MLLDLRFKNFFRPYFFMMLVGLAMFSVNLTSFASVQGEGHSDSSLNEEALPQDWFVLPEDQEGAEATDGSSEPNDQEFTRRRRSRFPTAPRRSAERRLRTIFRINGKAFNRIDDSINFAEAEKEWQLTKLELELALSGSGLLGVLVAKGEVAAKITYVPTEDRGRSLHQSRTGSTESSATEGNSAMEGKHEGDENLSEDPADLFLNNFTSFAEIKRQINPLVKAVMATGKIYNEDRLREGLEREAKKFQDLMRGISAGKSHQWWISKFRLDISAGASGMVQPGLFVGGVIKLRFEWVPVSGSSMLSSLRSEGQKNLDRLIRGLSKQFSAVPEKHFEKYDFHLKQFRVGLGMFAKVNFAIAKGAFATTGYAYFKKNKHFDGRLDPEDENIPNYISLVDTEPTAKHIRYARRNRIPFTILRGTARKPEEVVYRILGKIFAKGVQTAAVMTEWILRISNELPINKWEPVKVEPQFALSLSGSVGVASLGGKASLEISFAK